MVKLLIKDSQVKLIFRRKKPELGRTPFLPLVIRLTLNPSKIPHAPPASRQKPGPDSFITKASEPNRVQNMSIPASFRPKQSPSPSPNAQRQGQLNFRKVYGSIVKVGNCLRDVPDLHDCFSSLRSVHRAVRRMELRDTGRAGGSGSWGQHPVLGFNQQMNHKTYSETKTELKILAEAMKKYKSLLPCLVNIEFIMKRIDIKYHGVTLNASSA